MICVCRQYLQHLSEFIHQEYCNEEWHFSPLPPTSLGPLCFHHGHQLCSTPQIGAQTPGGACAGVQWLHTHALQVSPNLELDSGIILFHWNRKQAQSGEGPAQVCGQD